MNVELKTYPNPDNRKSWKITAEINSPKKFSLQFIPDKLMANHEDLKRLLERHISDDDSTPEENALRLIESVNNELVPIWLEVTYEYNGITITIEDEQPGRQK